MSERTSPVGIDLGTTNSCVAWWKDGHVEIIAGDQGKRTTPSYVAYAEEEEEPLVGHGAKYQARFDPQNTLFDAKRLIGRSYDDPTIQKDMKHWPFNVVDMDGKPFMEVMHRGITKSFAPEEVSKMVLQKMKQIAEDYIGGPVRDVVITCPAYFNNAQREATKRAGISAGLNVLRIINEPTAAAIAYGLEKRPGRKNVIVFDFGGGTFDVSLVTIDNGEFRAMSKDGDTHLGGEDLNNILVEFVADEFKKQKGKDIMKDLESLNEERRRVAKSSLYRLRHACEIAKCELSISTRAVVDFTYERENLNITISRARFEQLCMDTFRRCITILESLIEGAKMKKSDIDDVVLVGGSTRIPCVQRMVSEFFGGKELKRTVNPDEAVAYGAAIQAAIITGLKPEIVVVEVTPMTLGIKAWEGENSNVMVPVVPCRSHIPCKFTHQFSTKFDNQTTVSFPVYEGEKPKATDNNLLGEFTLTGIPPAPKGVPKFEVTFDIDADNILTVTARDKADGNTNHIVIRRSSGFGCAV